MAKKIILIVTPEAEEAHRLMFALARQFGEEVTVFHAADGQEALTKMRNAPPRVLITELELPKVSGTELLRASLSEKEFAGVGVIVLSDIPDSSSLADDVVRGKLKTLPKPVALPALFEAVSGVLSRPLNGEASFQLRFLSPGDLIFREGEKAECAFLVKRGKLRAFRTGVKKTTLGLIEAGEFVGEMAYINGENRSASVEALEESELVEIPLGTLDLLIFSKPAWTKALLKTLATRLREANQKKGLRST